MGGATTTSAEPAEINMAGMLFWQYANRYYRATLLLEKNPVEVGFDPVMYQLCCQAIELYLKAFIWLNITAGTKRMSTNASSTYFKKHYGHDISKLWDDAKAQGIRRLVSPTLNRDSVIRLVSPYYKQRKLVYSDINMIVSGYRKLREQPNTLQTLRRLAQQLSKSLHQPILRAS